MAHPPRFSPPKKINKYLRIIDEAGATSEDTASENFTADINSHYSSHRDLAFELGEDFRMMREGSQMSLYNINKLDYSTSMIDDENHN